MSSPGKRKKSTGLKDIQFYHRLTRCGVARASSRVSSAAPWLVGRIQRPVVPGKANRDSELAVHLALDFLHEPDQLNARKHKPPSETETTSTLVRKTRRPPPGTIPIVSMIQKSKIMVITKLILALALLFACAITLFFGVFFLLVIICYGMDYLKKKRLQN